MHMVLNRNKRSVTLDLRKDEGKEIFWRLLETADVFLDGNSTGAMDKRGVGHEVLMARKPDLVDVAISGLGHNGPSANVPTHGQSMSALAASYPQELGPDGAVRRRRTSAGASTEAARGSWGRCAPPSA
jgi:crotonobetainyl-CoA:carnitine CoA-transferase CaiB-like acyl-CoA transferase